MLGCDAWVVLAVGLLIVPTAPELPTSFFTGADRSTQLASYQALLGQSQDLPCPQQYS